MTDPGAAGTSVSADEGPDVLDPVAASRPVASTPRRARTATTLLAVPLALAVLAAAAGPWFAPHGLGETVDLPYTDPGGGALLGTDHLGRDVWSRVLHGGRPIVVVPVVATAVATVLGGLAGMVAAATGRRARAAVMAVLDVMVVLPPLLVLLVLLYRFGARPWVLVVAVVTVTTPFVARYTRAAAAPILASGYVETALAMGERRLVVWCREVVPNLVGPVVADAGLRFVGAIYLVASAGFLGFGADRRRTDWGAMIAENIDGARLNPWAVVAPCVAIAGLTVSANLLADRAARRRAR